MPPRRNKPKVPIYVIDEEFTNMDSATLKNNLAIYRERFADTKSRRNYIQMDRDMVQSFYDNTQKEIENIRIQIINKETDTQKLEEQHQMEIRVFLHKQKQLEYDQEKSNKEIEVDGEKAKNEAPETETPEQLKEKITALEGELATLKGEKEAKDAEVATLTTEVEALNTLKTGFEAKIKEVENLIAGEKSPENGKKPEGKEVPEFLKGESVSDKMKRLDAENRKRYNS